MRRSFRVGWRPDGSFLQLGSNGTLVQKRPVLASSGDTIEYATKFLKVHQENAIEKDPGSSGETATTSMIVLAPNRRPTSSRMASTASSTAAPVFTFPDGRTNNGLAQIEAAIEQFLVATEPNTVDDTRMDYTVTRAYALLLAMLKCRPKNPEMATTSRRLGSAPMLTQAGQGTAESDTTLWRKVNAFRAWLVETLRAETAREVRAAMRQNDAPAAIFAALVGGDADQATELAFDNGYSQLSVMIAAGSSSAPHLREQIRMWKESGASRFFPPTLLRIYTLLSGDLSLEHRYFQQGDKSVNFLRWLGLLLEYSSPNDPDLSTPNFFANLVKQYDELVAAGQTPAPEPVLSRPIKAGSTSVLYELIRICDTLGTSTVGSDSEPSTSTTLSLKTLIDPDTHSFSPHDYSAAFGLASTLSALNVCEPLSPSEEARLLAGFSQQLINGGRWDLGVYVVLFDMVVGARQGPAYPSPSGPDSVPVSWRQKVAKEIIMNHYGPDMTEEYHILKTVVGIPTVWLEAALAQRASAAGDLYGTVSHLVGVDPKEARKVLEEYIVPTMLFRSGKDVVKALDMLSTITTDNSSLSGVVIRMYRLTESFESLSDNVPEEGNTSVVQKLQNETQSIKQELMRRKGQEQVMAQSVSAVESLVPMGMFLAEALRCIDFMSLQLESIASGSSIWRQPQPGTHGEGAELKVSSELQGFISGKGPTSTAISGGTNVGSGRRAGEGASTIAGML